MKGMLRVATMQFCLPENQLREAFYKDGLWAQTSIYDEALRTAAHAPDRPAVRDRHRRLTYAQLLAAADHLAGVLRRRGLKSGDRVAVWLPNRLETIIALLACSRNGYICCPSIHRSDTVQDVLHQLGWVGAAAVINETGFGADARDNDLRAKLQEMPTPPLICTLQPLTAANAAERPFAALERFTPDHDDEQARHTDPNSLVYIAFTSGTTSEPKGVMHSNNTLLANARGISRLWSFDPATVIYTLSPLSHNLGFGAMVTAISCAGEVVLSSLHRGESLKEDLIRSGATFVYGVPAHAMDLLQELRGKDNTALKSIRGFRISGAPVGADVVAELLEHGITPQKGYGMTEACSHHCTLPDDDAETIRTTSGCACPGYEVKIWSQDDPNTEVPLGEEGQIGGRGASLMLGYYKNPQATQKAFNSSGWFMTGDLGRLDSRKYLRITGRIKDLIIRGGHNIVPARIEALAMRHDSVDSAALIPIPDARLGERLCLIVLPRSGCAYEPNELLQSLADAGLSKYEMPEFMARVDHMPVTPSGKIIKRSLISAIHDGELVATPVAARP